MGGRKFTDKEIQKAIEMYNDNCNTIQISKELNRSQTGVERLLKREGVMKKGNRRQLTFKKNEIAEMILLYQNGISTPKIGMKFGVTDNTVSKILKQEGIILRPNHPISCIQNLDYFHKIDSEDKAYFLGLIISDGSVIHHGGNKWSLRIELDITDKYIIDKFAECIGAPKEKVKVTTRYYPGRKSGEYREHAYLCLNGKQIADDLAQYGVVPRKTYYTYLPLLDNKYMPHLIRGIFDGDGSVYYTKKDNGIRVTQYGTHELCKGINSYLHEHINTTLRNVYDKSDTLTMLQYGKKTDVLAFKNFIYQDAHYYLTRKKNKFEDYYYANAEVTV